MNRPCCGAADAADPSSALQRARDLSHRNSRSRPQNHFDFLTEVNHGEAAGFPAHTVDGSIRPVECGSARLPDRAWWQ